MPQFVYWYAYFDTMFLKKNPTINKTLAPMVSATKQTWPDTSTLPQLCECFKELQQFILEQKNWSESICTIDQLNKIESDVTNVLLFLEVQKIYIKQFWGSKRRVQASISHFYAIMQIFIGSIIPYQNMTLFQCKAANKLCVKIINLQNLFKQIMKKVNTICSFFSDDFFSEQTEILKNFFQNFVVFMRLVPKIKKAKMFHVSQLSKYVLIVNCIQICQQQTFKKNKSKVKNYLHPVKQKKVNDRKNKSLQKNPQSFKVFHGVIIRSRKRHSSCPLKQRQQNQNTQLFSISKKIFRFIFPTWIRRHSIKHRKQSLPKLAIQPLINLTKGKSSSQFYRKYSPREEKEKKTSKYRNKSATKNGILIKSASIQYNLESPRKFLTLVKQYSSVQKLTMYQTSFKDEDQINHNQHMINVGQIKQLKIKKSLQILGEKNNRFFDLNSMRLVEQNRLDLPDKNQTSLSTFLSNYIAIKQIEKIIYK